MGRVPQHECRVPCRKVAPTLSHGLLFFPGAPEPTVPWKCESVREPRARRAFRMQLTQERETMSAAVQGARPQVALTVPPHLHVLL